MKPTLVKPFFKTTCKKDTYYLSFFNFPDCQSRVRLYNLKSRREPKKENYPSGKVPRQVPYFLPLLRLLKSDPLRTSQADLDPSSDRNRTSLLLRVRFVVSFCTSCEHHTYSMYHRGVCSGIYVCELCSHRF